MSLKKMFRRGSTKREDVYKVGEPKEEEVDNGRSLGVGSRAERRSERNEEKKERRNERCASAGAVDRREPHYPQYRRDVFTFFDICSRHKVDIMMNKCIPEWLRYLTKEYFQAKDLIPCEYRLGRMHFDDDKFWFSFRLKQCATEDQRRVIEQLFGCQDGNYQLCDPEKLADMNDLISSHSDGGSMSFMKSTRTMTDTDILKMEVMRKGKERMEEKYSDEMYTVIDDSYASFTIWTKDGPWRKYLKKYDFETFYHDDRHVYEEIVNCLLDTPSWKLVKAIDKEMGNGIDQLHNDNTL